MEQRIGIGIDYHRFKEGRKLVLGGAHIPYPIGLDGHSDADIVIHAIADAMLGALSLGDIGFHFPNTDPAYKDIDSMILLKETLRLIRKENFDVGNIDVMLSIEKPKISPFIQEMKSNIARVIQADESRVSIKATTTEKMGFIGREEGAAAHAVVLLKRI